MCGRFLAGLAAAFPGSPGGRPVLSYVKQTKLRLSNLPARGSYRAAVIDAPNFSHAAPPLHATQSFAMPIRIESEIAQPEPAAVDDSALSEEEVLLLQEKATLMKAVEELRRRRRALEIARRKAENHVHRRAEEEDARHETGEEAFRRLEEEEKVLRRVTEDLVRQRAEMEAARTLAADEVRRLKETQARTHSHGSFSRQAPGERKRIEERSRGAKGELLRLAEPQAPRYEADHEARERLTLGQRLRAEIEGLAAAQKKSIDAARAQLN